MTMENNSVVLPIATMRMLLLMMMMTTVVSESGSEPCHLSTTSTASRKDINVVVVAPNETEWVSYTLVNPAVQLAIQNPDLSDLFSGFNIITNFVTNNENLVRTSPDNAYTLLDDMLLPKLLGLRSKCQLDAIIGMARGDYIINLMKEKARFWNIPVISLASGNWRMIDKIKDYPRLTLAGPTDDRSMINMLKTYMKFNDWSRIKMITDHYGHDRIGPRDCKSQALEMWKPMLETHGFDTDFDWYTTAKNSSIPFDRLLEGDYRVFLACMKPDDFREMMIWAYGQNYTNGDYVFLHVDDYPSTRPWYDESDTQERNERAVKAFQAVQIITSKKPASESYKRFSSEVKKRALEMFPNGDIGEGEVNNFVGSYHDAVVLYLLALNETLQAGKSFVDGEAISQRMRGKTFEGIMGTNKIDENGIRLIDYSLLTMNPLHDMYEVAVNYYSISQQLEPVPSRQIYWIRGQPPADKKVKADVHDGSQVDPDNGAHRCADVMNVLLVLALIVTLCLG